MIRSELIMRLAAQYPGLTHQNATRVVDAIFGEITDALARGGRVEVRGFGSFSTTERRARIGRNPRTGDAVEVIEKRAIQFKTGKGLRDLINRRVGARDGEA